MYSFGHINLNSILQMATVASFVLGLMIASHFGAGLVGLSSINAVYIVANTAVFLFALIKILHWRFPRLSFKKIRELTTGLLKKSVMFWALGISSLILTQSSVFMVSISSDLGSAGDFSFFQKIFSSLAMLHLSALAPLWPKFCSYKEQGRFLEMKKLLHNAVKLSLIYYGIGIGFIVVFGGSIVNIWSGRTVHYDILTIIGLSFWAIFFGWANIFSVFLNGIGKLRNQVILVVSSTIGFFPIAFCLGKKYGPAGIPLALAIVMIGLVIVLPFEVNRFLKKHLSISLGSNLPDTDS